MLCDGLPPRLYESLKALCCLANASGPLQAQAVASAAHLPPAQTAKILQLMTWAGFVESRRGTHGGFWLVRQADHIRVTDVADFFAHHTQEHRPQTRYELEGLKRATARCHKEFARVTVADLAKTSECQLTGHRGETKAKAPRTKADERRSMIQKEGTVSRRKISWLPGMLALLVVGSVVAVLLPDKTHAGPLGVAVHTNALPQFARRYNLKCSACHTITPVLNEQGLLFQRLGYHLPPSLRKGVVAPKLSEIQGGADWNLTNNASFAVADFSYSAERTTQEGQSAASTSAFQVAAWNAYFAGWVPDTNFFYHAELDIVTGGTTNPDLSNACIGYGGGTARNSWYVVGGREHLQVAQGTRAAQIYSLLPSAPLLFETTSPTNFIFDQSPVGVSAGYTWISSDYKRVFAASAKVMNGDNPDGSEILGPSARNSKSVWADIDYWYAPESGVTFVDYYGKKDNFQTNLIGNQFTFHPDIRRQGVFGNYKLLSKIDFLGGWMHGHDDWVAPDGTSAKFISDGYYGAVDYYIQQGFAVSGRYDLLHQTITGASGVGMQSTHDWTIGVNKTFTPSGNIIGRVAYSYLSGREPVAAVKSTDKLIQADISFNF
jgi:DNA-binding IscR family transcriptional regulator